MAGDVKRKSPKATIEMIEIAVFSILLLSVAGTDYPGYDMANVGPRVYQETEGCVDVQTLLPSTATVLRIDKTDYNISDDGNCYKSWDETDHFPCTVTKIDEGAFEATAHICDAGKHTWAGWRMDALMKDGRFGYFTVYFSQGGEWKHIKESCIQADRIPHINIDATGQDSVEIECVRNEECPMGFTTTIQLPDRGLCSTYWTGDLKCLGEPVDGIISYTTILKKPDESKFSFAFCSTGDAFMSYVVKW